jgi:predicted AAA+ superfamily ATPase
MQTVGRNPRWLIIYVYLYMGTKEKIIAKINEIEDEQLLKEILSLINIESELGETYELTEEQKSAVNEGLNDFNNGRFYSQNEADELIKKWLENK